MENKISALLNNCNSNPVLFIGSGFSRRYLNLPTWEQLLQEISNRINKSEFAFRKYVSLAKNESGEINLQKVATLIEDDLIQKWYTDDKFNEIRNNYIDSISNNISPLKIEIANYINNNSNFKSLNLTKELELFSQMSKKNISSIITTNYDTLLEYLVNDYKVFVGQEELIFSNLQGIAEIYKIHGCCTKPESIVIDEKDYKKFAEKGKYLAAKIMTLFMEHPVIFIGYSISDENIINILENISVCLSQENIEKLKNRLFFVEWNSKKNTPEISESIMTFNKNKQIMMTKIELNDFSIIYNAILKTHSKYPVSMLRRLKESVYNLVLTSEPTETLKVAYWNLEDDTSIENLEFAIAIGPNTFSKLGYKGLTAEDLFFDIVFDNRGFDANYVVSESLLPLFASNSNSLPFYKYISKSNCEINPKIQKYIKNSWEEFLTKSIIKDKIKFHDIVTGKSINDLINEFGLKKGLYMILLMDFDNIELDELHDFLVYFSKENRNLFSSDNTVLKSNFRKLVMIYDWLKYYEECKKNPCF